ncbi:transglutaminase family protein [Streptomyces oryzae]|uniref:Transglutaminase family protein n=1 Tax=Streptomyces oryzae TaxID=1434886 RepID=A0ABS3XBE3_9ACTN|nr:transglutaminase-like domain-containing protein [Streptomyces oryzae]MBO8192705.1 transglutaminase family protein [Streptomyces oryzae]
MDGGNGVGDQEAPGAARRRFAEAARQERPDLALLCLLIGAEAARHPDGGPATGPAAGPDDESAVDRIVDEGQAELDRLAGLLPFERGRAPEEWVRALERTLGDQLGFGGSASDYQRLESSLLPEVLRRRRGLPILLSVVWTEVARRAGAPVYGVALPGHFVVGFGDPVGEHMLADPFGGGKRLDEEELSVMVAGATGGAPLSAASLRPAGPLETVLRVLNNIRAWAASRPEQSGVRLWAVELSLLLPHHPGRLRFERAQLLVERGDFIRGAREMEAYADVVAAMEPNAAENMRRAARAARARLN